MGTVQSLNKLLHVQHLFTIMAFIFALHRCRFIRHFNHPVLNSLCSRGPRLLRIRPLSVSQRIAAVDLAPGLQYFGRSIHGTMDMNDDGSVDLAVGSLGAAVLLWLVLHSLIDAAVREKQDCRAFSQSSTTALSPHRSRSVVRIYTSVRFEPSKVNIFVKDCQRGGKDVTCMSAIVCFNITARTAVPPTQEIGEPVKIIHCVRNLSVEFLCSCTWLCPERLFYLLVMHNLL